MLQCQTKLLFLLVFSLPFSFQDTCKSFAGVKVHDYVLLGYRLASFITSGSFSCAHRCLSLDLCKSYNYALSGAQQGLCELNSAGRNASKPLQYRPGFVFVEAVFKKLAKPTKSCLAHWQNGARISRIYGIQDDSNNFFDVFCDFGSEPGWVWTLIMSQTQANRDVPQLKSTSFTENAPLNEGKPNWEAYRLSLETMKYLQTQSTHWRATCSFPALGVDYTDYARAKLAEFDPLIFEGNGVCKKVEYLNVRGSNCTGCTSGWWQVALRICSITTAITEAVRLDASKGT